jgi:hypothetical protein
MELEAIFDHFRLRTALGESLYEEESYLRPYKTYELKWRYFGSVFSGLEALATRDTKPAPLAFVGGLFGDLIRDSSQNRRVAFFDVGLGDYAVARQYGMSAQPVWRERFELHKIYLSFRKSQQLDQAAVKRVIAGFQRRLERLEVQTLVLWNDVLFVERCMILAARNLEIPSFVIQHGLYMSDQADARIIGGNWADHVLTWGQFFSDMFVEAGIASRDQVKLLGYPRAFIPLPQREIADFPIVCLLGQDWERYGTDLEKGKIRFTQNVIDASKLVGLPLVYRPHPGESRAWILKYFPQVDLTPASESLVDAFFKYDVFISLTSTALIEAGMHGRIALELIDPSFKQDDFAQIGACHSRLNQVETVTEFLKLVKSKELGAFPLREHYVWRSSNLAGQLQKVLQEARASSKQI